MAQKKGKTTNKKPLPKKRTMRKEVQSSVIAVALFALTLILALSVYHNLLGIVGKGIYALMHGLFGLAAYVIPFFSLWLAIDFLREEHKVDTVTRIWMGSVLTVSLSALCYLFEGGDFFKLYDFSTFFTQGIPDMASRLGGIVGGIIAYPMICIITKIGFAILTVAIALICALTFFDLTLYQIWCFFKGLVPEVTEEESEKKEEKPLRGEKVEKQKRKKGIDVIVADDADIIEEKAEDDGVIFVDKIPEPEPQPEIIVDGEDVEIKPFSSIPFFVHDDINPEENINSANIEKAEPAREKTKKEPEPEPEIIEDAVQETIYMFPPKSLLETPKATGGVSRTELEQTEKTLMQTLSDFGIEAKLIGASVGPIVTRYEISPSKGVRVSKITSLADDIALSLAATSIRIEAPIPGKAAIGIEVPNKKRSTVFIKELLDSPEFTDAKNPLTVALGRDISGNLIYGDLSDMPHLLVAGATGSGKSVCINTILMSILYKARPDEVKLILIDPKVVELEVYNKIPHLIVPVVSNPKKAAGALQWAVNEMERRYNMFFSVNVRNVKGYNEYAEKHADVCEKMSQIVIVIDELADLMMTCAKEVEDYIVRLCQKARAAGIYLIIATQRPSVNVVTGLIKANVPSRIAFAVTSQIDSRVILDGSGAEKLLGRGDMLFKGRTMGTPQRVQCCFVSDSEVESVVEYIKKYSGTAEYDESANAAMENYTQKEGAGGNGDGGEGGDDELDEMFWPAVQFVIESGKASTSNLQRKFKLGYARAARIIDIMEEKGIIGAYEGAKPRQVIMTMAEYQEAMVKRDD
ncbi:MAG: DNA translocase FtsK [Clostridia bacterium]|nr:DNA translocase FtsK [Clostridia bacterium]